MQYSYELKSKARSSNST
uniref:Uncharacterized protein n=1 Tax=Arundo donax TaxID=35708 RepID=A0A0A9H5F9_ARUDO